MSGTEWAAGSAFILRLNGGSLRVPDSGPKIHPDVDTALAEAKRLATKEHGVFYVFSAVAVVSPVETPVEVRYLSGIRNTATTAP